MVVDAVMSLDNLMPLDMIGMKKVSGGSLEVSNKKKKKNKEKNCQIVPSIDTCCV